MSSRRNTNHVMMVLALVFGSSLLFAVETNSVWVDYRDACVVSGAVRVAPSSGDVSALPKVDGAGMHGWSADALAWDTSSVADGWHALSIAGESATPEVLTVNAESIAVHDGVLQADEVWGAGKVHVVRGWVRIPEGRRLVIANGAVVKFCQNSGILNQGTLSAVSAVLTAIEDDTVGGDTNLDGSGSAPSTNSYAIRNEGTLNAINNTLRYATADSVFASMTISANAFCGCEDITEVVVPFSVAYVGTNAFGDCVNLTRVIFSGNETGVAQNAFDGCNAVESIIFPSGMPSDDFPLGGSTPTVYINGNALVGTWHGYPVIDAYSTDILARSLLVPEVEGEAGQVLTKTEDGYEWQDIPVDVELNAESENSVQNKVVTAALKGLTDEDAALQSDIADLQAKDMELSEVDVTLKEQGEALTQTVQGQKDALSSAQQSMSALQDSAEKVGERMDAVEQAIQSSQGTAGTYQSQIDALQETVTSQQATIDELSTKLNTLLEALSAGKEWQVLTADGEGGYNWKEADAMGQEVLTLKLEVGWNLVAMPGRCILRESEQFLLEQIEIYTFDNKVKTFVGKVKDFLKADSLKPLTSYWMYSPVECTIHFTVAAENSVEKKE